MEKSILHCKAEHPSLFLTSLLLLGIGISHYILLSHTSLLILLLLSCLGLVFIIHSSLSDLIKSIVAILCIVYWGICIIQLNADDSIDFCNHLSPILPL